MGLELGMSPPSGLGMSPLEVLLLRLAARAVSGDCVDDEEGDGEGVVVPESLLCRIANGEGSVDFGLE